MIQWMHQLSKSWVATILMGALAVGFIFWGIADVFTGSSSSAVATVGSTEIDSASFQRNYRNFVRNQSQQMGTEITPEMAQRMGLGMSALQQMISRTALINAAKRMHLTVPDSLVAANVRAVSSFQGANGQFDHNEFLRLLQGAGYTEDEYLDETRKDMLGDQVINAVQHGFVLPEGYAKALFLYLTERRAADYVVVMPDAVGPVPPPSDSVLAAYVKDHPERFSTPEYRTVDYAMIGPDDLAGQVNVSEKMIAQDYEAHKATYQVPERREIQQLEFPTEAEAKAARAKLDKGESFEQLAAERKVKPADLAIGALAKSDLGDSARADAAFSLKEGEVSQPVKGAIGGFVLMRVTKIVPAVNHPLAEVHDTIKKNLAVQLASAKLIDVINAYSDARSSGADIAEAAKKAGMKSGHLAAVDQTGAGPDGAKIAGLPADPEFLTQAFAAQEGDDVDPFQAKSGEYYALKVTGHTPPKPKTLDQVRAEASAAWLADQQHQLLIKKVGELANQAQREKSLAGIAKSLKVPVQHSPGLTRQTADTTFSAELVQRLFSTAPGGISMAPQGNNVIIAQLTGISHELTPPLQAQLAAARAQLSHNAAGDLATGFENAVRLQQGVKIDQRNLQSVTGGAQ